MIGVSEIFGKGLQATKHYKVGEVVLIEAPFCTTNNFNFRFKRTHLHKCWNKLEHKNEITRLLVDVLAREEEEEEEDTEDYVEKHFIKYRSHKLPEKDVTFLADTFKVTKELIRKLFSCCVENSFTISFPIAFAYLDQCIYDLASYTNHRCVQYNCDWYIDLLTCEIKFIAREEIFPGEWITITYQKGSEKLTKKTRIEAIEKQFDFTCKCIDCELDINPVSNVFRLPMYPVRDDFYKQVKTLGISTILTRWGTKMKESVMYSIYFMDHIVKRLENNISENIPFEREIKWKQLSMNHQTLLYSILKNLRDRWSPVFSHETRLVMGGFLTLYLMSTGKVKTKAVLSYNFICKDRAVVLGLKELIHLTMFEKVIPSLKKDFLALQ